MKFFNSIFALLLVLPLMLQGCSFLAGAAAGAKAGLW